jgi:hypothetical protein
MEGQFTPPSDGKLNTTPHYLPMRHPAVAITENTRQQARLEASKASKQAVAVAVAAAA